MKFELGSVDFRGFFRLFCKWGCAKSDLTSGWFANLLSLDHQVRRSPFLAECGTVPLYEVTDQRRRRPLRKATTPAPKAMKLAGSGTTASHR